MKCRPQKAAKTLTKKFLRRAIEQRLPPPLTHLPTTNLPKCLINSPHPPTPHPSLSIPAFLLVVQGKQAASLKPCANPWQKSTRQNPNPPLVLRCFSLMFYFTFYCYCYFSFNKTNLKLKLKNGNCWGRSWGDVINFRGGWSLHILVSIK